MNVTDQFIADCVAEAERCRSKDRQELSRPEEMLKNAESSKAQMLASPGKQFESVSDTVRMQSIAIDENYLVVGTHMDSSIKQKIINHEYVDFACLLLKDRITKEEDHHMEIINKGSYTYFVPVSDRENTEITSHTKWEQAFRVFSNVYTRYYPDRATALIQYSHIIFSAAQTFAWDNVYMYDKEFRIHLSNYPQRSWAVILQQAWSMCLCDKVKHK